MFILWDLPITAFEINGRENTYAAVVFNNFMDAVKALWCVDRDVILTTIIDAESIVAIFLCGDFYNQGIHPYARISYETKIEARRYSF